jgi:hypothetical protein
VNARRRIGIVLTCALLVLCTPALRADEPKKDATPKTPLDALRAIEGTWVKQGPGMAGTIVFKTTAQGSTVMETMFPGSPMEMMNAYHMNGDNLMVTHYCAGGNQPRMKLVKNEGGVMQFDFVDVTNLKNPDDGCMGRLVLEIAGDTLTERWFTKKGDAYEDHIVITLKRQS